MVSGYNCDARHTVHSRDVVTVELCEPVIFSVGALHCGHAFACSLLYASFSRSSDASPRSYALQAAAPVTSPPTSSSVSGTPCASPCAKQKRCRQDWHAIAGRSGSPVLPASHCGQSRLFGSSELRRNRSNFTRVSSGTDALISDSEMTWSQLVSPSAWKQRGCVCPSLILLTK